MLRDILHQLLSAIRFAVLVVVEQNMYNFRRKLPGVSENTESKALVRWVEMDHGDELLIFHIKNEAGQALTSAQLGHLRAMGVRSGAPDYFVVHRKTHRVVFIELKKRKGGKRSKEQKVCISALGKRAKFCNGWHEAAKFIEEKLLLSA